MKNSGSWIMVIIIIGIIFRFSPAGEFTHPRMGIVISEASYHTMDGIRNTALGWSAVANLSGIPYDCLFLSDVVNTADLSKYPLLVFAQCGYVETTLYDQLPGILQKYLAGDHANLIIDGLFGVYDETGKERDHSRLSAVIGLEYKGLVGDSTFRLKVHSDQHYITSTHHEQQFITQHLQQGINSLEFKDHQGEILITAANQHQSFPYLTCAEKNNHRIVLIGDFNTRSGVASFFRNSDPRVSFANQLYDILVRSVYWAIYGSLTHPFPAPQVSNADLTAIIRLDGDGCSNLEAQTKTIDYLISIATESGVVAVYAFVSDWAARAGWDSLAPLAGKLEQFGGQIGTHSKTHGITRNKKWQEELDGSSREIEARFKRYGSDIGKVDYFVNPGNTIPMEYYGEIARRFSFFMTHGGQMAIPLGYGNVTWFTGESRDLVVLNDVPAPDYQWFYDGEWSYTTPQITAFQESIFDHMYQQVKRGVIYNQMWHDYGITAIQAIEPPRTQQMRESGSRIINRSNIALYDALKSKFATRDIYCPDPQDLTHKLRAMAQWNYTWINEENKIFLELDLSSLLLPETADFIGGMGLRIENSTDYIQSVNINDQPYFAFHDRRVILPSLKKGRNRIQITLGPEPPAFPRLIYVSKRMPAIRRLKDRLDVTMLTRSKARFSLSVNEPFVLLNADFQEWNRKNDYVLSGYVTSDRTVSLYTGLKSDFFVTRATVRIQNVQETKSGISLDIENYQPQTGEICFQTAGTHKTITLNDQPLEVIDQTDQFKVTIPEFTKSAKLLIRY